MATSLRLIVVMVAGASSSADTLQPALRIFLERRVSAALAGSSSRRLQDQPVHPCAAGLVEHLASSYLTTGESKLSAWMHKTVTQAVAAIENDASLSQACSAGELSLLQLAEVQVRRRQEALNMYKVINGHHREMRKVAKMPSVADPGAHNATSMNGTEVVEAREDGHGTRMQVPRTTLQGESKECLDDVWQEAIANEDALRDYAAAATQIGSRQWVRDGIDWCVEQANTFFREGTALGSNATRKAESWEGWVRHAGASTVC